MKDICGLFGTIIIQFLTTKQRHQAGAVVANLPDFESTVGNVSPEIDQAFNRGWNRALKALRRAVSEEFGYKGRRFFFAQKALGRQKRSTDCSTNLLEDQDFLPFNFKI